ncbi:MAG: hypothetical protein P8Q14_10400, partial [Vicingaceae bacterium]|nr:hypothetical protein [Vicingaceae bacterium]
MKNILKHTVSFSMILILLVSTLQFSLYKMECLLSGNTTLSLTEFDDCNKKPVNDCSFSEQCCCFHEMSFDFDFETNLKAKTFKIFNNPVLVETINPLKKVVNKNET